MPVVGGRHLSQLECVMATIMIRCPRTGREISTGLETDPAIFRTLPVFFSRAYCPLCRVEHEWFAQDAWVCDEESVE